MAAPVILFDGVCNLCHAAVAWVLARDQRQIFRFASLQSAAARQALAEAGVSGELPDSVILVDDEGVHARSEAAVRIAQRLGFPWSLVALGRLLPGSARDAVYSWIARNRYGWFGRRDACLVPTPELAGRFLDAGETIEVPPAPAPPPAAHLGFFELLIYSYLLIYIFPFPLSGVPGAGSVTERYDELWQKIIQWIGPHLLGVDASILPGGSGDTTYNYVETFTDAVLALGMAAVWRLWFRTRWAAGAVREAVRIYVRYSLGAVMLGYGWHKLFPLQMMAPGPDRLVNSLAETSPMGLLWTFIGLSPAYQMLCGLVEVLGGALLLFRRTTLLGALISAVALAQVVALNFCYDVPVKLFSSHLLLSSLFLIAPDLPRLAGFFAFGLPAQPAPLAPYAFANVWSVRARHAAKGAAIALFALLPIGSSYQMLSERNARPRGPLHGLYAAVDSGAASPWIRIGINTAYNGIGILRSDGSVKRYGFQAAKGEFTLMQGKESTKLTYREPAPGQLAFEGIYEGKRLSVVLRRLPDSTSLLTTRGFRWVNERPFNR